MRNSSLKTLGAKAANLRKLQQSALPVPPFIVIENRPVDRDEFHAGLTDLIDSEEVFAVRSSALVEDNDEKSFAGHFYSEVGVSFIELYDASNRVFDSFRGEKGSAIIQSFINSDKAGVIFTDNGQGNLVVNANFGLCKTVVEGNACDEYILNRKAKVISRNIDTQKKPLRFDDSKLSFDKDFSAREVLTRSELKKLVSVALKIEKIFGKAQDIEWCIKRDKIYILQSRPVTSMLEGKSGSVLYDSANIAESYSGLVKPLTFSFARQIYKTVYINLLCASGASRRKVNKHIEIFDNMLRLFYGRMYYNMNNWYLMMSFIPGYNRNKKNLEQMITSNMTGEVENEIAPGLLLKMFYPLIVIVKLIFLSLTTSRFKSKVKRKIKYYRIQNFENYDWQKCLDVYADLRTSMLEKWHIPVENDFLVMSYFGILKRNIPENELQEMVNFDNISIRQINQLSALSKQFYSLPELQLQIDNLDVENYELTIDKYPEIKQALNSYFDVYGGRFANELKLESPDIEEDSQKLLKLLKLYKNFQPRTTVSSKGEDKLPDKFFLRFALKKFKKYASKREEMRLLRSNSFSLVRKIFNRMGAVLSDANLIDEAEDIYYVDIDTLLKAKSVSKLENLQSQIKKRKQLYSSYNIVQPLPYFKLADGDEVPVIQEGYFADEILNGRPCTPGTMEGTVRVFPEYFLPETIDFDVLVTSHTDPGWTPLIGLSKALIIEHGGVLSHAAIVSRELGIPTVIGLQGATQKLKTGEKVSLNGSTGQVIKISGK